MTGGTVEDVLAGRARWALHEGDCLAWLPTLPDGCVDAVVTDPPYGLSVVYNSYQDSPENLRRLVKKIVPEARRVAPRVFITPGQTQIHLYPAPDWILAVVWDTTGTFGKYGYSQWMPLLAYGNDISGFGSVNGVIKSDVVRFSGGASVGFQRGGQKANHPCPKPLNVMSSLVARLTHPGSLVLDPFAGSGTTGVACLRTGRRFIGCEIDPAYAAAARKRLDAADPESVPVEGLFSNLDRGGV